MQAAEETMESWDGVELFYRAWIPPCFSGFLPFFVGHN